MDRSEHGSLKWLVAGTLCWSMSLVSAAARAQPAGDTPAEQPVDDTAAEQPAGATTTEPSAGAPTATEPASDAPTDTASTTDEPAQHQADAPPAAPPEPPASLIPDGEAPPMRSVPPAFPPAIPNIDYGGRLQVGLMFQNPDDPEKVNDVGESVTGDIYMNGQIHRFLKWQVSLNLTQTGAPGAPQQVAVNPLDVLARFEPTPEFNIYLGRMLVMADRFAPSGPWGIDEWFYPGFFPLTAGPPALPKAGPVGRDIGSTIWGAFDGHLKYYVGAFNLYDPTLNPLFTGRLQLSLLGKEPAFYQRTTYYGTKDLLSVGVGGQYQKDGTVQPVPVTDPPTVPLTDDHQMVTADVNVEKNIGDAGTLSVVGTFSKFMGDYQFWDQFWLASVGYMLPKPIGIGKLRGTVRYQSGLRNIDNADPSWVIDAQLSYLVAAWFARMSLGYRRAETWVPGDATVAAASQPSNMVYLGVTLADP